MYSKQKQTKRFGEYILSAALFVFPFERGLYNISPFVKPGV